MNRLILALLALFAGLAAPVESAQARIGGNGGAEIGAVDTMVRVARGGAILPQSTSAPVYNQDKRDRTNVRVGTVRTRIYIPSVLYGPDRALE